MRSREMLRRLNRVAPAKEPDPLAEALAAILDCATEDQLLACRAIYQRVQQEKWERPEDWDPELSNRLATLLADMAARQPKDTLSGSKTKQKKNPSRRDRGQLPR